MKTQDEIDAEQALNERRDAEADAKAQHETRMRIIASMGAAKLAPVLKAPTAIPDGVKVVKLEPSKRKSERIDKVSAASLGHVPNTSIGHRIRTEGIHAVHASVQARIAPKVLK